MGCSWSQDPVRGPQRLAEPRPGHGRRPHLLQEARETCHV